MKESSENVNSEKPSYCDRWLKLGFSVLLFILANGLLAVNGDEPTNQIRKVTTSKQLAEALPPAKWQQVENSVDRALAWMATQQRADGSFPTYSSGQPGVTSLCIMAFLSRGHQPGVGPYGQQLNKAIDFVLSCQREGGLICMQSPGPLYEDKEASHTAVYNHAISGLMLGEIYGQINGQRSKAVKQAIENALQFSRQMQLRPKAVADKGGWRYLRLNQYGSGIDSDLSVTGWQLMFMRSARNAEFNVPQGYVDEAMAYVRGLWDSGSGAFYYRNMEGAGAKASRGMTGAGILSLSLSGQHHTPMALAAGDWLLKHPYTYFGELVSSRDRFFYSAYYCSQAMAQLGGRYWEQFFPPLVDVLLNSQARDGSWPPEVDSGGGNEAIFGNDYTTALAVLALTPPYQLLPVYQR